MRVFRFWILPALVFYALALGALTLGGFRVTEILRDPAQSLRVTSLLGFLSNVGVWFWVAAGAICFSSVAMRAQTDARQAEMRKICLTLGGFSLLLAADDLFMIHDRFIAEGIMVPLYIYLLWRLLRHHGATVMGIEKTAFLATAGFLAGSVMVDAVQEILPISYSASQIIEEGCKFLGGASWLYFCHRAAGYGLTRAAEPEEGSVDDMVNNAAPTPAE
jgi:hypothetical protein